MGILCCVVTLILTDVEMKKIDTLSNSCTDPIETKNGDASFLPGQSVAFHFNHQMIH